jgi:small-conductance mechanosensitive channel
MGDLLDSVNGEELATMVIAFLPRLFTAVVIFLLFWVGYRVFRTPLRTVLERAGFADALIRLLVNNLFKAVVLLFGLVMAAGQVGINIGAALAGIGVVGVAVGFAAQETLADMIAGFLIFWDRPFKIGDYITVEGLYGEVTTITMRTTRLRSQENTYVVLPNRQIAGNLLVNHSMYGETRVNVPVGIAYKEKIEEARQVLLKAVDGLEGVMTDPAPGVVATGLGDSSVNLEVRVWVDDAAHERQVFFRVLEASKVALDDAGIEIPFPHLQLFVDNVRKRVWKGAATVPSLAAGRGSEDEDEPSSKERS